MTLEQLAQEDRIRWAERTSAKRTRAQKKGQGR